MPAIDLADLRDHLNISNTQHDTELLRKLAAAERHVANIVGPLAPTVATETYPVAPTVLLRRLPVISVQTVTHGGLAQTYRLNSAAGLLVLDWRAYGTVDVTYTAGWADLPADITEAVLRVAGGLWRSQRGAAPLPLQGGDAPEAPPQFASLLDASARELLEPYRLPAGQVA